MRPRSDRFELTELTDVCLSTRSQITDAYKTTEGSKSAYIVYVIRTGVSLSVLLGSARAFWD